MTESGPVTEVFTLAEVVGRRFRDVVRQGGAGGQKED